MNSKYKETYIELYHGTTEEAARDIIENGFKISGNLNSWCGPGVYFYREKSKAHWAAKRKCHELNRENPTVKVKAKIVYADIIDLPKKDIFDLRVYENIKDFDRFTNELLENKSIDIEGEHIPTDKFWKNVYIRSMLISFYCQQNNCKLVIGEFKQQPQSYFSDALSFTNSLDIIFASELIFCVKDCTILKNIHVN